MRIFNGLINALFPNTCIACGEVIAEDEQLCDYCFEFLERIDFTKSCTRCGMPKKNCDCRIRVFSFSGAAAPFYSKASAKDAMYKYKFSKNTRNAEFFAQQMALTVKSVYRDIEFDGVTYVPLVLRKFLKRGFNQSGVLANKIAEILNLPFWDDLLYCKKSKKSQHDIKNPKERFKNVEGLYGCKRRVNGKTILLIDDIKTTGATLNECAKQLILNGADNVYCLTGLITNNRKEK